MGWGCNSQEDKWEVCAEEEEEDEEQEERGSRRRESGRDGQHNNG